MSSTVSLQKVSVHCFVVFPCVLNISGSIPNRHSGFFFSLRIFMIFRRFSQNCEKRLLASSCLSVRPFFRMEELSSHWTDFHEIRCLSIYVEKSVERIQVWLKSDNNNGTLHEDLCTFMIISRWILLRTRNVSDKSCRENQNTHFMFNNFFSKMVPFMR